MDDERFYELIRRLMYPRLPLWIGVFDKKAMRKKHRQELVSEIEREIRARQLATAVNRENERLAVKGP